MKGVELRGWGGRGDGRYSVTAAMMSGEAVGGNMNG